MTTATRYEVNVRDLIKPLPAQERFLNALYTRKYVLFGGAAGPGKSHILRWAPVELLLYWASQGHRGVRVGLFSEDYPTLRDRQISKMRRELPGWLGEVRQSQAEGFGFYMRPEWGGGVIALRNLDDPSKYASSEFAAVFVEELTKNPRQTFDDLRFRLRWPGIEHNPFGAAANPGSIGHAWVKKAWIDRDFSGEDSRLDPDDFLFIPAKAGDNPYLPASYWETLNSLPEAMRRAMLEGDWNVFTGQVFAEWRAHLHVIPPFEIPKDWTRWRAVDYGYANPFNCFWAARPPDKSRVVVYRELYKTGWRAQEQAMQIVIASQYDKPKGEGWLTAGDPSMFNQRHETTGDSLADEYKRAGVLLVPAQNDRMAGLSVVRENLSWEAAPNGTVIRMPRLQFFSTCHNAIRTIPSLPYDPIKTEDVDTDAEDHSYDTLRYLLMAERGEPQESGQEVRTQRMSA